MSSPPHVLISGASIAGPALAYWLNAYGWRTTVVERAGQRRDEGQNIDIRGAAREVARRMDVEDALRAAHTGERGLEFLDGRGRVIARFPAGEDDTGGGTAEIEILRGELSRILLERTRADSEYRFGDQIARLDDGAAAVTVTFESGRTGRFDLVVIAEGLRSRTRSLVFPDAAIRELGLYLAYLTLPRAAADTDWWRWLEAGRSRNVSLRPDNLGTTRAMLGFLSDVRGLAELERHDQVMILRRTFADVGWETPRILDTLDEAPLYFEAIGQAKLPTWSRGRVVVTGDAAFCASPVSGMSTSLALTGAYVLAGELATHTDHREALRRYEAVMRPFVARAQKLTPGTPRLLNPHSRAGSFLLRNALRVAASPAVSRLGAVSRLFTPPAAAIDLPDYSPTSMARSAV